MRPGVDRSSATTSSIESIGDQKKSVRLAKIRSPDSSSDLVGEDLVELAMSFRHSWRGLAVEAVVGQPIRSRDSATEAGQCALALAGRRSRTAGRCRAT